MQKKEYARACEKLKASHDLDPTATGTLLNLALCHERIGKPATAWAEFRQVAAESAGRREDRVKLAREHEGKLLPILSRVRIFVRPDTRVEGLSLRLDKGPPIAEASWGTELPSTPASTCSRLRRPASCREPSTSSWATSPIARPSPSSRSQTRRSRPAGRGPRAGSRAARRAARASDRGVHAGRRRPRGRGRRARFRPRRVEQEQGRSAPRVRATSARTAQRRAARRARSPPPGRSRRSRTSPSAWARCSSSRRRPRAHRTPGQGNAPSTTPFDVCAACRSRARWQTAARSFSPGSSER